ncbi:PIN domain-containing protein [archaeon]|nr:PIN domain-containing protein [Nanoarchaeota archaeon]MBU4451238.1 PIN domain-containing protein [Nanoarchaeota archaeon]MCG2724249.1 PIN domain-containing protein [archaeon]
MPNLDGLHFIDSSIFVSAILADNQARKALQYLRRVQNGTYEACVSHLVIGEIGAAIREAYDPNTNFDAFYSAIEQLAILLKGVRLHTPKIEDYIEKLQKLKELEYRVGSTDVRIIADAATSEAKKLITFDTHYNTRSVYGLIEVVNLEE